VEEDSRRKNWNY